LGARGRGCDRWLGWVSLPLSPMQSAACSSCCRPGIDASAAVHPLAGVGFEIVFSSGEFPFLFALCLCRCLEVKSKSGRDGPSRRGTFDRLLLADHTFPFSQPTPLPVSCLRRARLLFSFKFCDSSSCSSLGFVRFVPDPNKVPELA